jgi:hypothetical protein
MKILNKSSENEMIALFLNGEIKSERWVNQINEIIEKKNIDKNIILNPNLNNNNENQLRKLVLKIFRGYNNKEIFKNFPKKIDWNWALLDKNDILKIKYITYDYWEELTNGTRYAKDSVINIKNNKEIFGVSNNNFIKLSEYIKNGNKIEPLIILAPIEKKDNMIILEGHARLTAINLVIEYITEIKILIGFVEEKILNKWDKYY